MTADEESRRAAHVWAALGWLADRSDRAQLAAGSATHVVGTIDALVGRGPIVIPFDGTLQVGHDATVNSSAAPRTADVLGVMFCALPPATRRRLLVEIPAAFAAPGPLPEIDEPLASEIDAMLKSLRAEKPTLRRGSVRFEVAP